MSDSGEMDIQAHFPIPWMTDSPETDILAYAFLPLHDRFGRIGHSEGENLKSTTPGANPEIPATRQPDKHGSPHLAH